MRILVVDGDEVAPLTLQRALGSGHELRIAQRLTDALALAHGQDWRPELVISSLNLPDAKGAATVEALEGLQVPLLFSPGLTAATISRCVNIVRGSGVPDADRRRPHLTTPGEESGRICAGGREAEFSAGLERLVRQVAESAVEKAMGDLAKRLGLDDEEGVRTAVRLARGWEAAKSRFAATLTTGIASALLLALGAGLMALLASRSQR